MIFQLDRPLLLQTCAKSFLTSLDDYYCKFSNSYIILFALIFSEDQVHGICTRETVLSKIAVLASKLEASGTHSVSCRQPSDDEIEGENVSNQISLILLPLRDTLMCALSQLGSSGRTVHVN